MSIKDEIEMLQQMDDEMKRVLQVSNWAMLLAGFTIGLGVYHWFL